MLKRVIPAVIGTIFMISAGAAYGAAVSGSVFLDANGNGRRDAGEAGIAGVAVCNGGNFTRSDADGNYKLDAALPELFTTVIMPNGYLSSKSDSWYCPGGTVKADFALIKDPAPAGEVCFIAGADIQYNITKQLGQWEYQAKRLKEIMQQENAAFAVIAGDLTPFGKPENLQAIRKGFEDNNIRTFTVFGGHDGLLIKTKNRTANYRKVFGPDFYSWNYRGVHFIALIAELFNLTPEAQTQQWEFLKKDLQQIDKSTPVVLIAHLPEGIRNRVEPALKGYNFKLCLIGHHHNWFRYKVGDVRVMGNSPWRELDWGANTNRLRVLRLTGDKWSSKTVHLHPAPTGLPEVKGRISALPEQNWSDFWGGNGHRSSAAGLKLPLRRIWSFKSGDIQTYYSSPVIYNKRIYCAVNDEKSGRNGAVIALDALDGKLLWKTELADDTCSTVACHDGRVYAADAAGDLYALDADSGKLLWRSKGRIYRDFLLYHHNINPVALFNGNPVMQSSQNMCCANGKTGRPLWRIKRKSTPLAALGAAGNGLIPGVDQSEIYFANAAGKVVLAKERKAFKQQPRKRERGVGVGSFADNFFYLPSQSALRKIAADGREIWAIKTPVALNRTGTPAVGNGKVFLPSAGQLNAFNDEDGAAVWSFSFPRNRNFGRYQQFREDGSPALIDGKLVYGSDNGSLYVFDSENGKVLQEIKLESPLKASAAVSDNLVCIMDYDGQIHMFEGSR